VPLHKLMTIAFDGTSCGSPAFSRSRRVDGRTRTVRLGVVTNAARSMKDERAMAGDALITLYP
jgi:hypothetical protein